MWNASHNKGEQTTNVSNMYEPKIMPGEISQIQTSKTLMTSFA